MSTYLVTGAAGFIASRVCEKLIGQGHTVIGIDNLNDYYDVRLKDYRLSRLLGVHEWVPNRTACVSGFAGPRTWHNGSFLFRYADIENLSILEQLFQEFRFDAVFNLAARAGVRASMLHPHAFLSTNTEGTLNILECQRRYGVNKHVLASTSSLYAGSPMPFREDQPVNAPLSPYAAAKKAAELMAYSYHALYGIDVTVLRYFTVFGPAGRPDMAPFRFIKWISEGTPITLFGDGTQSRDFTYVDDIAAGTVLAEKPIGYEIINLGAGQCPVTLQSFIRRIEKALGKSAIVERKPSVKADMQETWADNGKAMRLLGWRPMVNWEAGLDATIGWHVENARWLESVSV